MSSTILVGEVKKETVLDDPTSMHVSQIDLYQAILAELSRQNPKFYALPRHMNAIVGAANLIVREFSIGEIKSRPGIGIQAWRKTDQVGASSDFMAAILGSAGIRDYAYPHDPADFGRCITLLEAAPELKDRLPKMAETGKEWAALVLHWDKLEAMYTKALEDDNGEDLYNEMKRLLGKVEGGK